MWAEFGRDSKGLTYVCTQIWSRLVDGRFGVGALATATKVFFYRRVGGSLHISRPYTNSGPNPMFIKMILAVIFASFDLRPETRSDLLRIPFGEPANPNPSTAPLERWIGQGLSDDGPKVG